MKICQHIDVGYLDEEEKLSLDSIEKSIVGDGYILPSEGHRVFVLQPGSLFINCKKEIRIFLVK